MSKMTKMKFTKNKTLPEKLKKLKTFLKQKNQAELLQPDFSILIFITN